MKFFSSCISTFLLMIFLTGSLAGYSQVSLTATSGTTTGTFTTLKGAFDKINDGTHKGIIVLKITGNTTELATASLSASATDPTGAPYYTSINIYPTGTRTITGSIAAPLINLNGADNVTIDGRANATGSTKSLTISNTSAVATAGTSTIRFINDASSNTVKYCTLKGSSTDAAAGIVFFSTTTGSTGNDNNTIDNNDITCAADASRPLNAIYALGATANNDANTISNNKIYNFLSKGTSSNGIRISSYNSGYTISGNSFYETASFAVIAAVTYKVIAISAATGGGNGFTVSGNYIGGNAALAAGTAWTKTGSNGAMSVISVATATGTANSIQGNTIKNISWTNTAGIDFYAIELSGATVANIGTVTGNTIGATTGTGSIVYTNGSTAGASFYGINLASTGVVDCRNNTIGAITAANSATGTTLPTNFYGIVKTATAGTTTISNNTIGSTATASSIQASSTSTSTASAQMVYGINSDGTGTVTISGNTLANLANAANTGTGIPGLVSGIYVTDGTNTISGNIVRNLSNANANDGASVPNASVTGIVYANSGQSTAQTISGNTVYNLSNSYASFGGEVIAIYYNGSSTASSIDRNFIHSLSVSGASSVAAALVGIRIQSGSTDINNNIISLGGNTKTDVYGIYQNGSSGQIKDLFFNTVYISGTVASGTNFSRALQSSVGGTRDIRNNVLVNTRSTTSGSNLHYALYIGSTGTVSTLNCNNNNYYVSGTGGTLGYYGADKTSLPIVSSVTGNDASSISTNPAFSSPGTTAASFTPTVTGTAATGTGITVDYTGGTRSSTTVMGALAVAATVTTTASSSVTAAAASTGGDVTAEGGVAVTARGVVWSTATNPTIALSTKTSDGSGSGSFTSSIRGLQGSTTYYVRAYATNSAGTSYGSQISFTTPAPSAPILTTTASSGLTATTVSTGGNISSDGGRTITQRGVVFGTSTAPTVALNTKTFEFNPTTGAFSSYLYDLTPGTTYYARAYATNILGTAYGNEISFTTPAQTWPDLSYGGSPVFTLGVGVPANLPLTNTGGTPDRVQVSTLAGTRQTSGTLDGIASSARFNSMKGATIDGSGNMYVADQMNHRIRKITQEGMVSTIAGSSQGYLDGNGTDAQFNLIDDVTVDPNGDLYVTDRNNFRIRKITSAGVVSTLAGGVEGNLDGTGSSAQFSRWGNRLTSDGSGNIYLADLGNQRIRKITSAGVVTTFAGSINGTSNGTGTAARFLSPADICLDGSGNLYVSDQYTIRKINSAAVVTTLAGDNSASSGFVDATGVNARFGRLLGIDADIHGNVYVEDVDKNRLIRKITPTGVVTTYAGTGSTGFNDGHISTATFSGDGGLTIDRWGNLFQMSSYGMIRQISSYRIEPALPAGLYFNARTGSITGTPTAPQAAKSYQVIAQNSRGNANTFIEITIAGPPIVQTRPIELVTNTTAKLNATVNANGGATSAITIKYSSSQADVDAGNGTSATLNATSASGFSNTAIFANLTGLTANTTYYYRTSATNSAGTTNSTTESFTTTPAPPVISYSGSPITLMKDVAMSTLSPTVSGIIETMQGSDFAGSNHGYLEGTGTAANFNTPKGLAFDGSGNLYVADQGNHRIRRITPLGVVTTLAGSGTAALTDGTGTAASFNTPHDICLDGSGNLYVSDHLNHSIRRVVLATGEVTTLAGNGTLGSVDGTGTAARFKTPVGISLDGSGNLYVSDNGNHRIRKIVLATGEVTTLAGSGAGYLDGTGTTARFYQPTDVAVDATGDLYVADANNHRIRKITPDGVVSTWAGDGSSWGYDGIGVKASFNQPNRLRFDGSGNLYVTESIGYKIRKVTPAGVVTTIAGGGSKSRPGHGLELKLVSPSGIAADASGNLFFSEANHRIFLMSKYSISPALPAGLSFNSVTGAITGTPTVLSPATTYTVTTGNTGGKTTATFSLAVAASIMSSDVTAIGTTTATAGGTLGAGYTNVVARGVVWHPTSTTPTVDMSTKTSGGTTTGAFTSSITGLSPNTSYNVRAYVTYGSGTTTTDYGSLKTFRTNALGTFADITKTFGDPKFSLTAPTALSTGAFSFSSSNTGVATISGSEVTITGAGTSTITATQAATSTYAVATQTLTLTVNKATPTIVFTIPSSTPLKDANNLSILATSSNSEPVTIAIGSGSATGTLSGSPGSYTLGSVSSTGNLVFNASTSSTANHNAATRTVTLDVTKNNQTITFSTLAPVTYAAGLTQTLSATTDASGLSVSFAVVSGPGNITGGNTLNITGPGLVVITASQAGNGTTNPAPDVTRTLTVNPGAPTVSSFTPASATEGDVVTITGQYFENVSAVSFGGTAATSFTVVNSTTITAVLGTGHTGAMSVTTTGGTGTKGGFRYKVTWTGATKTFNSTGNWSGGRVPQTDDDIIFSATAVSDLDLDGSKSVGHVDFNGSGRAINLGAHHLTVKGNLTMPGNITGTGMVIMGGSSAQTIIGGGSIPDLEINNSGGVTISGSGDEVNVTGRLRLTGGTLNTNGKLRLSSNSGGTARVGQVTGAITGNVIAERYVQRNQNSGGTGRAWRLVSVPVQGSGNLRDFFMNGRPGQDLTLSASRDGETDNSGTPIVGNAYADAASANAAGFDWIGVANQVSSLRSYVPDAGGGSFASENVPSLLTSYAAAAQGYMVFTRGDRKLDFPSTSSSSATTFRSAGTLKTGNQTVTVEPSSTHKFTLVGNPYMSVLDLSALYASNTSVIEPSFWIWDANIAGSNYQGAYINLYKSGTQWVTNTGSYVNPEKIESGMAFFVEPLTTLSSSGTLTITEAHKSSDDAAGLSPLANSFFSHLFLVSGNQSCNSSKS